MSETLQYLDRLSGEVLFAAERDLLRYLNLSEFLGYDGRLSDLLLQTNHKEMDYARGRTRLYFLLLDEIEDHFKVSYNLRAELKKSLKDENQSNELKQTLKTKKRFHSFFIDKLGTEAEKQGYTEVVKIIGNTSLKLLTEYLKSQ